MTWTPLSPLPTYLKHNTPSNAITIQTRLLTDTFQIVLVVRSAAHAGLPWLKEGERLGVALGSGQHAGKLRITPGGPFQAARVGGRMDIPVAERTITLRLRPLDGMERALHTPTPLKYTTGDGWLQITLPDWATPAVAATPSEMEQAISELSDVDDDHVWNAPEPERAASGQNRAATVIEALDTSPPAPTPKLSPLAASRPPKPLKPAGFATVATSGPDPERHLRTYGAGPRT